MLLGSLLAHAAEERAVPLQFLLHLVVVEFGHLEEIAHEFAHDLAEPLLHVLLHAVQGVQLVAEFVAVEGRKHQEFLLDLTEVQGLHGDQESLHGLKGQVLDDRADLRQVVLDPLFTL